MVKTNSKKSLIAMIAMVVLLIASIAMGITGAWFTDKEVGDNKTFTFGSIDIEWATGAAWKLDDSELSAATEIMPGCKITYNGTVNNTGSKAYVAVVIKATLPEGLNWSDVGATNPSDSQLYTLNAAGSETGTSQAVSVTIELPTTLSDQTLLKDKTITVSVSVYAVQYEHFAESFGDEGHTVTAEEVIAAATAA